MSRRIVIDHLARVEGHGGVTVELDGAGVRQVRFDIFEGARLLETAVRGRRFDEVAPVASRICAICSAAHALTSLKATEQAFGVAVSDQTGLLRELLYRGENIASHALHLFLLAAPDYLGLPDAAAFAAQNPEAVAIGLRLKRLGNRIQEVIGGRAVHPVNAVVGGFARLPSEDDLIALRADLRQGLADSEAALDLIASLPPAESCSAAPRLAALVSTDGYGYYSGQEVLVTDGGAPLRLPAAGYRSWLRERSVEHSHAKHSSVNGSPFMVGALARVVLRRESLPPRGAAALARLGLRLPPESPLDNNKAQAVELVVDVAGTLETVERLLEQAEQVVRAEYAYEITHILSDNRARSMIFGSNNPLILPELENRPVAAKTGTSEDARDLWTVGYTTDLVVGVWVGNTDNSPTRGLDGVSSAALIWHDFMVRVHQDPALAQTLLGPDGQPIPPEFPRPPGIIEAPVCAATGKRPIPGARTVTEILVRDGGPRLRCDQVNEWELRELRAALATPQGMTARGRASLNAYAAMVGRNPVVIDVERRQPLPTPQIGAPPVTPTPTPVGGSFTIPVLTPVPQPQDQARPSDRPGGIEPTPTPSLPAVTWRASVRPLCSRRPPAARRR